MYRIKEAQMTNDKSIFLTHELIVRYWYPFCYENRSKAGWASKERSTPEGYNRERHAWQFEPPFPNGMDTSSIIDAYIEAFVAPDVVRPPKKKKSPEERKAIREKKIIQSERASLRHVETALRKYNRANTTTVMPLSLLYHFFCKVTCLLVLDLIVLFSVTFSLCWMR